MAANGSQLGVVMECGVCRCMCVGVVSRRSVLLVVVQVEKRVVLFCTPPTQPFFVLVLESSLHP